MGINDYIHFNYTCFAAINVKSNTNIIIGIFMHEMFIPMPEGIRS